MLLNCSAIYLLRKTSQQENSSHINTYFGSTNLLIKIMYVHN